MFCLSLSHLFLVQEEPWADQDAIEVVLSVCAGDRMLVPASVPPPISRLMQTCWSQNPSARPSFEQIIGVLQAIVTEQGQAAGRSTSLAMHADSYLASLGGV